MSVAGPRRPGRRRDCPSWCELNGHRLPVPLLDSRWDFAQQCRRLIASEAYAEDDSRPDAA